MAGAADMAQDGDQIHIVTTYQVRGLDHENKDWGIRAWATNQSVAGGV